MLQLVALVVFPALMIFAAASDLFTMTISNRVSLALVAVFFPLAFAAGLSPADIGWHAACGALVLVLTFTMFALGWVGGGDAKLAAASALWLGFGSLGDYGLVAAISGGLLTLLILFSRKLPLPDWAFRMPWLVRLHDQQTGIPYGIALAIAGLLVYPDSGLWGAAASI